VRGLGLGRGRGRGQVAARGAVCPSCAVLLSRRGYGSCAALGIVESRRDPHRTVQAKGSPARREGPPRGRPSWSRSACHGPGPRGPALVVTVPPRGPGPALRGHGPRGHGPRVPASWSVVAKTYVTAAARDHRRRAVRAVGLSSIARISHAGLEVCEIVACVVALVLSTASSCCDSRDARQREMSIRSCVRA